MSASWSRESGICRSFSISYDWPKPALNTGRPTSDAPWQRILQIKVVARAPTRIDLAGGTLDIWPLYLFHQQPRTINVAINRYAYCTIQDQTSSKDVGIELVSHDLNASARFASIKDLWGPAVDSNLRLVARVVSVFAPEAMGITVTTEAKVPVGSGLGGSGALVIALCAALSRWTGKATRRQDWIELARYAEMALSGAPGGAQDLYSATYGGVNILHWDPYCERREAIDIDTMALQERLVLGYTGQSRNSTTTNWQLIQAHLQGDRSVRTAFDQLATIAARMCLALRQARWGQVAELIRADWEVRSAAALGISTPQIENIFSEASQAGATGWTACGAGGGGSVVIFAEPDRRSAVEAAIQQAGATIIPFRIDRRGVVVHQT